MSKKKLPILIGAIVLVALLVGALFLWKGLSAKPQEGNKAIIFEVVLQDGTSTSYRLTTEKEYLAEALAEAKLVEYTPDGLYNTIGGVTADWSKDQGWWNIKKDGVALNIGMNDQPIADGEHYEAVYSNGGF